MRTAVQVVPATALQKLSSLLIALEVVDLDRNLARVARAARAHQVVKAQNRRSSIMSMEQKPVH